MYAYWRFNMIIHKGKAVMRSFRKKKKKDYLKKKKEYVDI